MILQGDQNIPQSQNTNNFTSRSSTPVESPQITSNTESKVSSSSSSSCKDQPIEKVDQKVNDLTLNQRVLINDSGTKSGEKKAPERIKKKTPWYSALYPTYKSRSEDFKRIFKELPSDERLIVDYSCAIQRDILVHGRLYISQNYLCFYANIFRWETQVTVKWKDVTSITKEKTALVIPNAILVTTNSDKHFLTSFATRDKTYLMVFRVWQNALMDQPMSTQEIWQWVHSFYGDELGLTSDDEDYTSSSVNTRMPDESKALNKPFGETSSENCPVIISEDTKTSEEMCEKFDAERSPLEQVTSDMSDNSESELDKGGFAATCPIVHEGRMLVHELVPINVDELFTLIFTNSKFCADLHESRKNLDVKQSPWEVNPSSQQKIRTVSLTVPLAAAVGPKQSQVTETQVMLSCSRPGEMYIIEVESTNAGVPYADSFYIATHFCLTRGSHNYEATLSVYCQIKYRKSVWSLVKGFIEKNCWAGLEEFYTALVKALEVECENHKVLEPDVKVIESKVKRRSNLSNEPIQVQPVAEGRMYPVATPVSPTTPKVLHVDPIGWVVLSVLLVLLVLNAVLYYKLWDIEEFDRKHRSSIVDVQIDKDIPHTHEEWIALLQKQEKLRSSEIKHWQEVLKKVVHLLREAEEALGELQINLHNLVSERVLSALKETYPESLTERNTLKEPSQTQKKQEL